MRELAATVCTSGVPVVDERVRVRLFDAANNASNEAEVRL